MGGFIILLNLFCFFIYSYFSNFYDNDLFLFKQNSYFSFFFYALLFYLIGTFDDKFNVSANYKFTIIAVLIVFLLWFDYDLRITHLNFTFYEKAIVLNNFSIVFTLFSFLLFINALNMIDGINLLCGLYTLFLLIIIYIQIPNILTLIIIFGLIPYLIRNAQNKVFLGDGGSILLSFLLSYIIIKSYNLKNAFYADEIFLFMMIPGIDMVRVALTRIFTGLHPFSADRNHLHHILLTKFNSILVTFIIITLIFVPIIINYFIKNTLYVILPTVFFYFLMLYSLRKKIS